MSRNVFDEIYFCPHTFVIYFNIPQKENNLFKFLYKFPSIYYQVNNLVLSSCFACHKTVVTKHNSQISCFVRYSPPKKEYFFLKRSDFIKNISLNRKIIIGHCNGQSTIVLIILIDGFKEKQFDFIIKKYVGKKT